MEKYKAFCLDLDGTVYRGTEPIPEAVSFIAKLQQVGIRTLLLLRIILRNDSITITRKTFVIWNKNRRERIMTSAIAAAKYCKENYNGLSVMMIGEKGLEEALEYGRNLY